MRVRGANRKAKMHGEQALPGKSNYFTGKDPSRSITSIDQYAKVRVDEVRPGVDVVYYGKGT